MLFTLVLYVFPIHGYNKWNMEKQINNTNISERINVTFYQLLQLFQCTLIFYMCILYGFSRLILSQFVHQGI